MNTTDNKENNIAIKTETLPAKKVSDSETHQLHVVIHPDINGFGRLFGGLAKQNFLLAPMTMTG